MATDKILIEATRDGLVTRLLVLAPGSEQKVRLRTWVLMGMSDDLLVDSRVEDVGQVEGKISSSYVLA